MNTCNSCGRRHDDGNWLICDACSDASTPGFRGYLKGTNPCYPKQAPCGSEFCLCRRDPASLLPPGTQIGLDL